MTEQSVIGRFNPELFERFRTMPEGIVRRALHSRLIVENEPLVKVLVAQLLGRETAVRRRPGKRTNLGGLKAPELIDWDDAMQAGRIGMGKALAKFDPARGKLSLYALHKIRYELQCVEEKNAVIHVPRGREDMAPKGFDFIEDLGGEAMLEDLSGAAEDDEYVSGIAPANDVDDSARFAPQTPSSEIEKGEAIEPLELFVRVHCALSRTARAPEWQLWNAYALHQRRIDAPILRRRDLVTTMCERYQLTKVRIRTFDSPAARALAGIRLQIAA